MATISTPDLYKAYLAYFGRPPDITGLTYFSNKTEAEVTSAFSASAESQALLAGGADIPTQINAIYQNLFNRDAEPAGLAYWTNQLTQGYMTLAQASLAILRGAQGSDAASVTAKYNAQVAFVNALDTSTEIAGYSGEENANDAREFLHTVTPTSIPSTAQINAAVLRATTPNVITPPSPTLDIAPSALTVTEGGTVVFTITTTNVAEGTTYAYNLTGTGITANDFVEGASGSVVIDANGKGYVTVTLANDRTTEGAETVKLVIGAKESAGVAITDSSLTPPAPTYSLAASPSTSVNEGSAVLFTLSSVNGVPGSSFDYTITGVSAADVVGGELTGTVVLDAQGMAVIQVTLAADQTTDAGESVTLSVAGKTATVAVNDTSVTPPPPVYSLTASQGAVNEGSSVTFDLSSVNGVPGTQLSYVITGVSAADVVGGQLTGTVVLDANGHAFLTVAIAADGASEGTETMTLAVAGKTAAVQINDTSTTNVVLTTGVDVPPYTLGTNYADTFWGNAATLNPGDNLVGGGNSNGLDVFNYATGDMMPAVENGFTASGIETFNLTSDAGLWIDMSGTSGVQTARDQNSRADMLLTNGNEIITRVEMVNTTVAHDLRVNYQAATIVGSSDVQNVLVTNVLAGSNIQIDGVETINLEASSVASDIHRLTDNALTALNISGNTSLRIHRVDFPGSGTLNSSNVGNLRLDDLNFAGTGAVVGSNTGNLTINSVTFGSGNSSVNASGLGGSLDLTLSNAAAAGRNVAVTGSNQADMVNVEAGFNKGDSLNGGGGRDTLVANAANLDVLGDGVGVTLNGPITNVEVLTLASGLLTSLNLNQFDTVLDRVNVNTLADSTVSISNLEADGSELLVVNNSLAQLDGKTVRFDGLSTGNGGTTVNVQVNNVDSSTTVTLQDYNDEHPSNFWNPVGTLNLELNGSDTFTGNLSNMGALSTLGLAGNADIVINSNLATVSTVNGGTTTGDVTINAGVLNNSGSTVLLGTGYDVVYGGSGADNIDITSGGGMVWGNDGNDTISASGAGSVTFWGGNGADTLKGGSGNDVLNGQGGIDTINGNAGADLIIGGLGGDTLTGGTGADVFEYDFITESQGAAFADTITDFVSGTDKIDLRPAMLAQGFNTANWNFVHFAGNANGFAAAQSSLSGFGGVEIVYDTQIKAVYVDVNGDGLIDGINDMIIFTPNTATMQSADFFLVSGTNFTAAVGPFNTANAADSYENTVTSNGNDIVTAQANQLAGSTANGLGGTNVMNITTTITAAIDLGNVMDDNFAILNLFGGSTAPVIGPDQDVSLDVYIGNAGVNFTTGTSQLPGVQQRVWGGSGAEFVTLTNGNDEARVGAGNDVVAIGNGFYGTVELGAGDDTLDVDAGAGVGLATLTGGGSVNDVIDAHNGSNLSGAGVISGFDRIVLDFNGSTTVDLAEYNALTGATIVGRVFAGGNNTINLIGAGSVTLDDTVENWTGDAAVQTFTLTANNQSVAMGGGDDFIVNTTGGNKTGSFNGNGGSDTFTTSATANIATAASWNSIENLVLTGNATSLTLTGGAGGEHVGFNSVVATGNANTFTVTTGLTDTLFGAIETYNLSNDSDNVTVSQGNVTVNLGDTNANTANVTGVTGVTVNGGNAVDTFNVSGTVTGSTFNGNTGNDVFNITGTTGGTFNGGDGLDAFVVNGATGATISGGNDDDSFSLSGTITGSLSVGLGTNTITFNGGVDVSGLTVTPIFVPSIDDVVFGNGTFTMTASQYNTQFVDVAAAGGRSGLDNADTIRISDAGTVNFSDFNSNNGGVTFGNGAFGTLVMASTGNDVVNFRSENASGDIRYLDISAGGNDKIAINNLSVEGGATNGQLTITGFDVATDKLSALIGGAGDASFQNITSFNTDLSISANGVFAINNALGSIVAFNNVADGGAVEALISAAVDGTGFVGTGNATAVIYGNGNAYLYSVDFTAGALIGGVDNPIDLSVELVGVLNNVAANSLTNVNFYV